MTDSKVFDECFALSRSVGRVRKHGAGDGLYFVGDVVTRHGIVSVYSEAAVSTYSFARNGRWHMRTEHRGRTPRGLAIQATKFARERANSPGHK